MNLTRRYIYRSLRTRNLVMLTVIVMLLYFTKLWSSAKLPDIAIFPAPEALQESPHIVKRDYFVPTSLKKKDWHNYGKIKFERKRVGVGENGRAATLPKEDKALEDKLYAVNGFNGALSDKIALNRSLPDIRHPACKKKKYLESLPTVSVVVPFHNEHWSTLLRTAYSVLYRSPPHLIKEVFLVDDFSSKPFLKDELDKYVAEFMPKVRVLRLGSRQGLISARLAGARAATADVLLFLDSHTEANVNWLPPLLEPIALSYRTVSCPFIDVVAFDTFEYRAQDEGARGAFDWELFYKRLPVLPQDTRNMPEPFESPVMAGGLFAISRAFFWELGGYDPGLDIWGGEQYELSFKIWQCGGRMVDTPCSRVGHIYRKFAPFPNPGHGDFVGKNYKRVAEVWMDEYAQYLYNRRPQYLQIDTGDISEQKALREKLHCKPFKWFMTQIAFDLVGKYPPVEPKPFAEGRIKPASNPDLCIDAHHGGQQDHVTLTACSSLASSEQYFVFSWHKDLKCKTRNMCWDLPDSAPKSPILLYSCHLGGGNQLWRYHFKTKQLKQGDNNNCVEYDTKTNVLFINRCDLENNAQQWTVDHVNEEVMATWDSIVTRITGPVVDND